jgi:hypothetical protein
MFNDITDPSPAATGLPHPDLQCTNCKLIDAQSTPEQLMHAVVADAEHWGVDWAEEKRGIYGVEAMLSANKIMTGIAMRGDLLNVKNPAAYYVSIAKGFSDQIDRLRRSR